MAKLSEAKDSSSFQILDEAVVPINKSKPKRSLIVVIAAMTSFFFSIFLVFTQEYLTKISDEDRAIIENIKKYAFAFNR